MEKTLSQRFIEAFEWTELTANALADKTHLNGKTVWSYTTGKTEPSYKCIKLMCDLYPDLSFEWITTGEGTMLKESPAAVDTDPAPTSRSERGIKVIEKIYQQMIESLKEQLRECNQRCKSLEESNKILLDMISAKKDEQDN